MFLKRLFDKAKKEIDKMNQESKAISKNIKYESTLTYNEESIYVDEFRHIKTTKRILEQVAHLKNPPKRENVNGVHVNVSFVTDDTNFAKDSIKYRKNKHLKCEMPPFQTYYSKFSNMTKEQKNWYFYWREQVVNGNYPPTDLSYIYVFVYELINYTFNSNAAFNVSMLYRLYEAYKSQHHIERFTSLIGDMLYELGEDDLAEKWSPNVPTIPPLYKQLQQKHDDLARISITYWKSHFVYQRESKFYAENKNKVYKTFKECLPLLEACHIKRSNKKLIDLFFEKRMDKRQRYLFPGMVFARGYDNHMQYSIENIYPTDLIHKEIVAFLKLSENVTRLLNGEKRQLQVPDDIFPPELKEQMLEHMSRPKEKGRFKTVKAKTKTEQGGAIPPKPEDKPKVVIEFNDERIKQLQSETDSLVDEVERRASEHQTNDVFGNDPVEITPPEKETKADTNVETAEDTTEKGNGLDKFFASSGDDIDNEQIESFLDDLTDIEKEFIRHFENLQWSKKEATLFLKSKGQMFGVLISSLNEKAQDTLEDNFLEEEGEQLVIFEEFETIVNRLKER